MPCLPNITPGRTPDRTRVEACLPRNRTSPKFRLNRAQVPFRVGHVPVGSRDLYVCCLCRLISTPLEQSLISLAWYHTRLATAQSTATRSSLSPTSNFEGKLFSLRRRTLGETLESPPFLRHNPSCPSVRSPLRPVRGHTYRCSSLSRAGICKLTVAVRVPYSARSLWEACSKRHLQRSPW